MFAEALKKICNNEVKFARNGEEGLKLIKENKENIFLIISDVNMPRINGLELKRIIEGTPELKIRSIPFIFHSTHDNAVVVKEGFALGIQGFIKKQSDFTKSVRDLELIIRFWSTSSVHPNVIN